MPSTWSAVNRCLFLLRTSPALEKACSDLAFDACAHNRRLAISGYLTWYLPHHCNTVVSLKSLASPTISTGISNHSVTNVSNSSSSVPQLRDARGIAVADFRKVDFHHSSLGASTTVWLLPSPSCSEQDEPDPWFFLCKISRRRQKQRLLLGDRIQKGWRCKVTNRVSPGLQGSAPPPTTVGIHFFISW